MEKSPKNVLQEMLSPLERAQLEYTTVRNGGPDHVPLFDCTLFVRGHTVTITGSSSKKKAEFEAAQKAIDLLQETF